MFLKTRHNLHNGFRSSCLEVFCEKDILKSFSKFTGKQLLQVVLIKQKKKKKETPAQVIFFLVLQNFQEHFYGIPPVAASEACKKIHHAPLQGNTTNKMSSFNVPFTTAISQYAFSMAAFHFFIFYMLLGDSFCRF